MKTTLKSAALTAFLAIAATSASAHGYKLGDISVHHPYAIETPKVVKSGGGYMTITNNGEKDDALVAVKADFPQVMLHKTEIKDGVATMPHMPKIVVKAGETVTFKPGSLHVMFMGLNGDPFEVGEKIPATLVFEKAGELDVVFNVEARNGKAEEMSMDHSGHDKSDPHAEHKHK
ncbi:hypothetical protein SAMN04515647_1236 [Cohaesibacter sp. ES.047]|uniref:copper chaperone PCu(A)C n=1 Tax=Cohaesibacter sp. ES.047 TaxID=1798205 RepID=UPI000BB6805C|nr:copper chaperone PCu(A)C [Cohaesibacter sp. ES.047]SNY91036.1 hypothetical protein SAMN04515647_1236 [Cohaesibacter sp. ES.047]